MANKKSKRKPIKILSANHARIEQANLDSYWSAESQLSQSILIYIAELLEELVQKRKPRKPTAYQRHVGKVLKSGGTILEAAKLWRSDER